MRCAIINSLIDRKALTGNAEKNSQYNYDSHLYKLTGDDLDTVYYSNQKEDYSEGQQSALFRVVNSARKNIVVLGIWIRIENSCIVKTEESRGYTGRLLILLLGKNVQDL